MTQLLQKAYDGQYEDVAASQTDQVMGTTGAVGDMIRSVLIVPASLSPGAVSIKDGNGAAMTIFEGGVSSLTSLAPRFVPLGMLSKNGGWKVTTGANVAVVAIGHFS